jgi:phosphatidylglycerol lysyltransferase
VVDDHAAGEAAPVSAIWSAIKRFGATAFGLILLVAALYAVQREFRSLSTEDISRALSAIPQLQLWMAAGWTVLAYAVLTIYDRLGSVYAGYPVSYARTCRASFCAYTMAHNLGFAAVSGAAVRYRFYAAWGLPPVAIAKVVAFTSLTFGLGGLTLGGLVLLLEPQVVPWAGENTPRWVLQGIGLLLWGAVIAYMTLSRFKQSFTAFGHRIDLPGFRMAAAQTLLACVDVAVSAMIFFSVLPDAEGLTFLRFLGIFVVAYTAGILAHVPGGLGVFDGTILLGLQPYLSAAEVIGGLLLFRFYYYIAPLFLAGIVFAWFEIAQRRPRLRRFAVEPSVADSLEVPALAALVGLGGAVLLFISALPAKGSLMEAWAGYAVLVASHFAASVVGSLLLLVGYGLMRRLRIARLAAILLLINGAIIFLLRGEAWWLWGAYLLVALLLWVVRSAFYRDAPLMTESLSGETVAALIALVTCALTLALISYGGRVAEESWWGVIFSPDAPNSLRFTVGLTGVLLLVAVARLLRPVRLGAFIYDTAAKKRLRALGAEVPDHADGVIFGPAGRAGFAFLNQNGVWLALGDPAGDEQDSIATIWRFRDICERVGVDPAFLRVGSRLLRVYGDIGLTAFPLEHSPGEPERWLACRAERDLQQLMRLLPGEGATPAAVAQEAGAATRQPEAGAPASGQRVPGQPEPEALIAAPADQVWITSSPGPAEPNAEPPDTRG